MKKIKRQLLLFFMTLCMLSVSAICVNAAGDTDIEAFVTRFYVQILDRQPDQAGLTAWSDNLRSGREAGANVGYGFIQSEEFINRNLSNDDYIKTLYRAFFDREADDAGLNAWLNEMDCGLSRLHVYKGFAESVEFSELCSRYGINRGSIVLTEPRDLNEGVTKYVARCYQLCLGRNADIEGLNAWCSQLFSGANSAKQVAYGFVFSVEFKNRNLSDEEYIKILYRVFMDREADRSGVDSWLKVLNRGKSRTHVFNGFSDSVEFRNICDRYGIYSGDPSTPETEAWERDYVKIIKDYRNNHYNSGASFALFDIDNNGIPELILTFAYGDELEIYSADATRAMKLLSFTGSGMAQYEIRVSHSGKFAVSSMEPRKYDFYGLQGTSATLENSLTPSDRVGCMLNGVPYSKATYDKYVDIFNGYTRPTFYFLDTFNGASAVGEITLENIYDFIS